MSNENFRREVNNMFDEVSGSPSPALRDRVRASIAQAPDAPGPYWIAAVAAAVIAVVIVGVLYVGNPLNRPTSSAGGPVSTPTASPSSQASASPSASPSATPQASAPFQCATAYGPVTQSGPATAYVSDVRTGTHAGYDRITITFSNGAASSVEVRTQSNAIFTLDPSGQSVTLRGDSGLLVVIRGADEHTSYTGSTDLKTGYSKLLEARQVGDFEGVVRWGIGLAGNSCYRVYLLKNPDRVVIDAQTGT